VDSLEEQLLVVSKPVRLVIAGNDPLVLSCLEELLRREKDFDVIARVGKETVLYAVSVLRPDILIMDLPPGAGWNGLALLRRVKALGLATRVVFLGPPLPDDQVEEAIRLGIGGLLTPDAAPAVLPDCIRRVKAGELWLGDRPAGLPPSPSEDDPSSLQHHLHTLTPREIEIVRLVCAGLRNKQIASTLEVAEGTVKTHLHHIYEKLTLSGRLELSLYGRHIAI